MDDDVADGSKTSRPRGGHVDQLSEGHDAMQLESRAMRHSCSGTTCKDGRRQLLSPRRRRSDYPVDPSEVRCPTPVSPPGVRVVLFAPEPDQLGCSDYAMLTVCEGGRLLVQVSHGAKCAS